MWDLPLQTAEVENIWQSKMRMVTNSTHKDCHNSICDTTGDRASRQGWQVLELFNYVTRGTEQCRFLQIELESYICA